MIRKIIKVLFYPLVLLRREYLSKRTARWAEEDPKVLANYLYKKSMGHDIQWDNPQDYNEKINWLKFYSDTTEWTKCADKYLVRSYVEGKGLGHILPKIYGVWSDANDIDFSGLPEKFVLKTNHGCATVLLVKEKLKLNIDEVRIQFNRWLKLQYGKLTAEPHYLSINPRIIAEEYLEPSGGGELVDYKLFMINGKFELALVCSDRKIGVGCKLSMYDKEWNLRPEKLAGAHLADNVTAIPRPETFDEMIRCAEILSSDFPQVRVDFYEVNNRLYFGELTFTSQGGYMNYIAKDELLRLGNKLILPKSDCN